MIADARQAQELIRQTLQEEWAKTHRAALGSQLKVKVSEKAQQQGLDFDPRAIGFANFKDLLSTCDFLTVDSRPGTDIRIAPSGEVTAFDDTRKGRGKVNHDFWTAILTFPHPGQFVGYDKESGKIVTSQEPLTDKNILPIEPVSQQEQIEWRREFSAQEPSSSPLATMDLSGDNALEIFSRVIQRAADVRRRWNSAKLAHVFDRLRAWSQANDLPESVWLDRVQPVESPDTRQNLYAILDGIPLEDLLTLRIPLGWLVKGK